MTETRLTLLMTRRSNGGWAWACLVALAAVGVTGHAGATENVDDSPYAEIFEPADGLTFQPGDSVPFSGVVIGDCGDGPTIPASGYVWTVVDIDDESSVIHEVTGSDSGSWTVPASGEMEQYLLRLTAVDPNHDPGNYGSGQPRITTHQVRVFSWPHAGQSIDAETVYVAEDDYVEEANPDSHQDPGKVVVKNPPGSGNSRVGFWVFHLEADPVDSAVLAIYSQNEITGGGSYELSWQPGDVISEGSTSWNGQPSGFTELFDRPFRPDEIFAGWWNAEMTEFYNDHLGETVTLRIRDNDARQIGPHFESKESVVYPENRRARFLIATAPEPPPEDDDTGDDDTSGDDDAADDDTAGDDDATGDDDGGGGVPPADDDGGGTAGCECQASSDSPLAALLPLTLLGIGTRRRFTRGASAARKRRLWMGSTARIGLVSLLLLAGGCPTGADDDGADDDGGDDDGGDDDGGDDDGADDDTTGDDDSLPEYAITGISFDLGTMRTEAPGSDNWAITWADDGHQYTSWGDDDTENQGCRDECWYSDVSNSGQVCELWDEVAEDWVAIGDGASSTHHRARLYNTWLHETMLPAGGVADAVFTDNSYNTVSSWGGTGDSAIWTGTYLAAEALRALATGAPEAKDNVGTLVRTIHDWWNVSGDNAYLTRFAAPASSDPMVLDLFGPGSPD